MFWRITSYLKLAAAYIRLNLKAHLEYRGAFITQVIAMVLNNLVWVTFWMLFFQRFPVLRGWTVQDVITLWALAASGFGLAHAICGNALRISGLIVRGQLDVWMLYPRTLLPHLLLGKMSATSWGDLLFGYGVYLFFVKPDALHLAMFTALTISSAGVYIGFNVMAGSLSFYIGNSEGLTQQWRNAMLTFSTYPATLFEGWVKLLLYTLIPAGFVTYLPIEALRQFSLIHTILAVAGAIAVLSVGAGVFYHGLRLYSSGNLMEMRG
ncbi:ABC-2 family transporter protein [Nostoc sp. LEGE 06077]|uniref:ABC transporter permease n=1 Tax=Nostoc sp. LEGE 06077 TaxID=915325 RepID=UPI00188055B6|nr:ABC-2 family transporter protein [Nostoc sp. LEGE 06077]MBE9207340.1 ABC-2 family transporter protein [Nostoc sp. LEGE 06077]